MFNPLTVMACMLVNACTSSKFCRGINFTLQQLLFDTFSAGSFVWKSNNDDVYGNLGKCIE